MKQYIVAGVRKGTDSSKPTSLNVHAYDEASLRKAFAWIDGPDNNNFRYGAKKLTLDELVTEIRRSDIISCENDFFLYAFRKI